MYEGRTGPKALPGDGVRQPQGRPGLVVVVGSTVFYLPYNEHGTMRLDARPFLYPAYFMHVNEAHKRIGTMLKKPIRTI